MGVESKVLGQGDYCVYYRLVCPLFFVNLNVQYVCLVKDGC